MHAARPVQSCTVHAYEGTIIDGGPLRRLLAAVKALCISRVKLQLLEHEVRNDVFVIYVHP